MPAVGRTGGVSPFFRRRRDVDPSSEETAVRDDAVVEEYVSEERRPEPPKIWPWLLALLLLVVGGLAAYWFLVREDEKATVPSVVGLQEPEARIRIEEAGLEADVDQRAAEAPSGRVVAQTPGAGAQLDEGEQVEIAVSTGPVSVEVPDVRGQPEQEAVAAVEQAGLQARVTRVFAGVREGLVVDQLPGAGGRVARGSEVELKVSKGRNLAPVPDVVGLTEEEAVDALREDGFESRIFDVPSTEPEGIVVSQSPRAGEQAPPDSRVRINVSSGEPEGATTERPPETTPTDTTVTETVP
jgi:eukaryotic-like serine/threonine-protein kinase